MRLRGEIDGSWRRNLEFFPAKFKGWEEKFSKVGFKAWAHTKLVSKFRGNPLRDDRDELSRNVGPKPTNQKDTAQKVIKTLSAAKVQDVWTKFHGSHRWM